jgi:hypothetical protein
MARQATYNAIDECFAWTEDGWYSWDRDAAHKAAKRKRDEHAAELRRAGRAIKKRTSTNNLFTRGGIGSGHPEISMIANVYYIDILD